MVAKAFLHHKLKLFWVESNNNAEKYVFDQFSSLWEIMILPEAWQTHKYVQEKIKSKLYIERTFLDAIAILEQNEKFI